MKTYKKSKLVYVLPEYDQKTPTHFAHLFDFIKKIGESFDVYLIIEKGSAPLEKIASKTYVQKFRFPFLRFLENFAVLKLARFKGYKTFYVHYSFLSAFSASLLTKVYGGKVFYWNCGLPWKYQKGLARRPTAEGARVSFEKLTYRLIDFLVTGTESLKLEYSKHYKIPLEKIKVMPNWIDLKKYQSIQSREDKKTILFIHRLSRRKGAHWLPDIINGLKDESATFIIIGDGPEQGNLKSQISNLKNIRLLGAVPNEEIQKYYALADLFIMPSEEEGFPRVLLEAMAMEVPFVAFDVGGVKEMIPPEFLDFVVRVGDIENFSLKIKQLLNFPQEELDRLKSTERNWVKKYDIVEVIDIFKRIIYNEPVGN